MDSNVYHQVVNEEKNLAEAVSFGTKKWLLDYQKASFCEIVGCNKHPVDSIFTPDIMEKCKSLQTDLDINLSAKKPNEGLYKCPLCNEKEFVQKSNLTKHIGVVHLKLTAKCLHCDLTLCDKYHLQKHMIAKHGMCLKTKKSFSCNQCGKNFTTKNNLNQHIVEVHNKIKNVKCDQCKATFSRRRGLQLHIRSKHDNELFQCVYDGCKKSFNIKGNMTKHVKNIHSKEK